MPDETPEKSPEQRKAERAAKQQRRERAEQIAAEMDELNGKADKLWMRLRRAAKGIDAIRARRRGLAKKLNELIHGEPEHRLPDQA